MRRRDTSGRGGALPALAGRDAATPDVRLDLETEAWGVVLGHLGLAVAPADPPPGLLGRIEAAIAAEVPDGTVTVRAEAGLWRERSPGVWLKVLHGDMQSDSVSYLLRCEPGAILPDHDHPGVEEAMMLEGSIRMGGLLLRAGDYHRAEKGSHHVAARTEGGCLVYVTRRPLAA
jgi:anti-sigma factor ChrR (cupin superfamily)